jgi:hypothetical protein
MGCKYHCGRKCTQFELGANLSNYVLPFSNKILDITVMTTQDCLIQIYVYMEYSSLAITRCHHMHEDLKTQCQYSTADALHVVYSASVIRNLITTMKKM